MLQVDKRIKEKLVVDIFGKEINLVVTCSSLFASGDLIVTDLILN